MLAALRRTPGVHWAEAAGSIRRGCDLIDSIELLAAYDDQPASLRNALATDHIEAVETAPSGVAVLVDGARVAVRCAALDRAGAALLALTGSAAHLEKLAAHARARGHVLTGDGLEAAGGRIGGSERAIYAALGLEWIPPEIREGTVEIELASAGALPRLLTRGDMRGDLHMHTNWSDGRDTIETMVAACVELGYEYIAITDHSQRAGASRTLHADAIQRQADEIVDLRERFPRLAILHGCEVDILDDGTLDFEDRLLERFDIVLASLHDRAGQDEPQLLQRYVAAMRNPLVTIITHPTNRMLPYRAGYELDWNGFMQAAVDTRTIVEIDGAPAHLDMNGELARQAVSAGVLVSVDSDCHLSDMLDRQMGFGVTLARRGWLEATHVVNTRPLEALRALLAGKREA